MTNEEAIKILEVAQAECEWIAPLEYQVAFDMAIEALEKQMEDLKNSPTQMSETSDMISRQAVIDAIINRTVTVDTDDQWLSGHAQCELEIIDIINALPSAEPEIIACADCKFWICHDRRCGYWNHGVNPLMWCSQAERRADE